MTNQDLIRALETVPEKQLRLLELARECTDPNGGIDLERCAPLMAEIEAAVNEAEAYTRETTCLLMALGRLLGP